MTPKAYKQLSISLRQPFPLISGLVWLALSVFYLAGVPFVPFHPDEATHIYMSADMQTLFSDPVSLAWQPGAESDPRARYRLLDAPLTRVLIGAGRAVMGMSALPADWNWSENWQENEARGALPGRSLLITSRYALAGLFPLSLILVFFTGRSIGSRWTGLAAMLLLGLNALALLHTRRAMAEGGLVFGVALTLFGLTRAQRQPWIAALGAALAFSAKQSALALAPAALAAILWFGARSARPWQATIARLALFAGVFAILTLALNPFLWRYPLQAAQAAFTARAGLVERQVETMRALDENQVLETPAERTAALLAHLFIVQPAIEDVGNYRDALAADSRAYLSNPLHRLDRGLITGGLLLALALIGAVTLALESIRPKRGKRAISALVLLALALQAAALLVAVPLPFQRYWMPLAPFTALLAACGLMLPGAAINTAIRRKGRGATNLETARNH